MSKISSLLKKWSDSSLVLRIVIGLVIGAVLGLLCPQWTGIGILGKVFVSALKAIAPILVALLVAAIDEFLRFNIYEGDLYDAV